MRSVTSIKEQIIDALRNAEAPMSAMEIAREIGVATIDDAGNVLRQMLRAGEVTRTAGRGRGAARWDLA